MKNQEIEALRNLILYSNYYFEWQNKKLHPGVEGHIYDYIETLIAYHNEVNPNNPVKTVEEIEAEILKKELRKPVSRFDQEQF